MLEIEELEKWIRSLPPEQQTDFFREAAKYFSSRELSGIITSIGRGTALFTAHKRGGVLARHIVELSHLVERWEKRS